jgi:hypothetical protein
VFVLSDVIELSSGGFIAFIGPKETTFLHAFLSDLFDRLAFFKVAGYS